jgi:hypothetical protein
MIVSVIRWPDMTPDRYDAFMTQCNASSDWPPAGGVVHIAARADEGMLMINVWDSKEHRRAFTETVAVSLDRLGVVMPASVELYEVENVLAAAAVAR